MERNCDMFLFQDEKRVVFYFFYSAVGSFISAFVHWVAVFRQEFLEMS